MWSDEIFSYVDKFSFLKISVVQFRHTRGGEGARRRDAKH